MSAETDMKTHGVILRIVDFKESDRIFDLFTENGEMLGFFARGARKVKSKFQGLVSLGNFISITYSKGKNLNYPKEISFDLKNIFDFYKKNLPAMYFYTDILNIVRIIAKDYESKELYQTLLETLQNAQLNQDENHLLRLYNDFLTNTLHLIGIDAELKCYISGEAIDTVNEPEFYYHPQSNKAFSIGNRPGSVEMPLIKYDTIFEKNYLQKLFYDALNTRIRLKF